MEMILTRIAKRDTYTIGKLFVNGQYVCDTLEPACRDVCIEHPERKIPGHTAIPEGRYAVAVSFSPRFKRWLPLLLNVPSFNTQVGRVTDSRSCERKILQLLDHRPEGEGIWLTIK